MTNLISIITPCYNSFNYIDSCIVSVLSQTLMDWELLIVDDCSTDGSDIKIKAYAQKDKRIKYLKTNFPSGSPTQPRNMGIENAKGRYIAFLDSDDIWLPSKLEEQLNLFLSNPNAAIVFSNYEKISEFGERNNRIIHAPFTTNYKELLLGNVIGCLTAIYDTEKVGKIYFKNINHEDYVLWLSILKKGYIAINTQSVTALHRIRKNSVSSNKLIVLTWQWRIYTNIERTGYIKAIYYFINYAYKAFFKAIK